MTKEPILKATNGVNAQTGTMRARGMKAQMTIIVDIIETMLHTAPRQHVIHLTHTTEHDSDTHNGCKLVIPNLDARRPVRNGNTADPACPMPAI